MAWSRDEANLGISGATAYSYTEVDWEVKADKCSYRHIGGVTSPYGFTASATATGEWWDGSWHGYNPAVTGTDTFHGYGDLPLFDINDSFVRQAQDRTVSVGTTTSMMGGSARSWIDYTVPHLPDAPTSLTATRVSDNKVTLSWTAPTRDYEAMCIERSVDGGSYSEIAVLWNTATSWDDTATSADHAYTYRLRAYYRYAYSDYTAATASIAMTPSAPQSMTTAASGGTNIDVTVVNPSPVATVLQYAVSTDGGSTWGAEQDSASLTSFSVSASGTVKIRVRNKNATGTSDWLVSGTITTICPPAKPTLTSPQSNVWDVSQPLEVSWIHNSLDGSAQTAAKVTLVKMNTLPLLSHVETYDPFTGNSKSISLATAQSWVTGLVVGDTLNVAVKTKGADASYSGNSVARGILLAQAPTVNITSPASSITAMPLSITATYSDPSGTCAAASYYLSGNGKRYPQTDTLPMDVTTSGGSTTLSASISASDFIFDNGESYTVYVTARSSSSLQSTANATFTTAFTEPTAGDLSMQNDPDTGYVSLLATFDNDGSDIEYSGNTNQQYDSEPSYVKSLTVEGQSEVQNGSLVSIGSVGVSGRNLSPFFAHDFSDTAFWDNLNTSKITQGSDGWAHIALDNTGSSGTMFANWFTKASTKPLNFKPSTDYTFVCEVKNGTYNQTCYIAPDSYYAAQLSMFANTGSFTLSADGTYYRTVTSRDDLSVASLFNRGYFAVSPYGKFEADIRISLYEGTYTGDFVPYIAPATITTTLRSAGSIHDQLIASKDEWTVSRKVGTRAYQSGDESDPDVLTDGTTTYYALTTPTTDTPTSYSTIQLGTAFTVGTELDSTFSMTSWDGAAEADTISVSRVNADGTTTPLLTDGASGSGVVDKYAPLNTQYQYAVTTTSAAHAIKTVYVDNIIETDRWFAYWGENIASAKWNPDNGGIQLQRPQKVRVFYAGRKDPVSYDGSAVSLTETPSWVLVDRSEVQPFVQLIEDGGRGVYKSCDGWVYHADFDLTLTPKYIAIGYYGGVGLTITRIAGDLL